MKIITKNGRVLVDQNEKIFVLEEQQITLRGTGWEQITPETEAKIHRPYIRSWFYSQITNEFEKEAYEWIYRCIYEGFSVSQRVISFNGTTYTYVINKSVAGTKKEVEDYTFDNNRICIPLIQFSLTQEKALEIINRVYRDNPHLLFYIFNREWSIIGDVVDYVSLVVPTDEAKTEMLNTISKNVSEIVQKVKTACNVERGELTEIQKRNAAKCIHDWLVLNNSKSTEQNPDMYLAQTFYAALSKGITHPVCASYAMALCYLCRLFNINIIYIVGYYYKVVEQTRVAHAWAMASFKLPTYTYTTNEDDWTLIDISHDDNNTDPPDPDAITWNCFCNIANIYPVWGEGNTIIDDGFGYPLNSSTVDGYVTNPHPKADYTYRGNTPYVWDE